MARENKIQRKTTEKKKPLGKDREVSKAELSEDELKNVAGGGLGNETYRGNL